MRSILSFLGLGAERAPSAEAETDTVRKIVAQLEALPADRARYVAAFAYILGRVANADLDISDAESRAMEALVAQNSGLPQQQAILVVEIAKSQNRLFGGTENYLVTREFTRVASRDQCVALLDCLFAVSAADGSISADEENQIRLIADELGLSPREVVEIRGRYSAQRSVMQRLETRDRGA